MNRMSFVTIIALFVLSCDAHQEDYKQRTADKIYLLSCRQQCLWDHERKNNIRLLKISSVVSLNAVLGVTINPPKLSAQPCNIF